MNNTITLQSLVERLAAETSTDQAFVEKFVRMLFDTAADRLAAGQRVDIPSVGIFAPQSIGDNAEILWQPAGAIADEVNAPFSSFEPVVLAADITDEQLNSPLFLPEESDVDRSEGTPGGALVEPEDVTETIVSDEMSDSEAESETPDVEPEETGNADGANDSVYTEPDETPSSMGWLWGVAIVVAACIGYLCATFLPNPLLPDREIVDDDAIAVDTANVDLIEQSDMTMEVDSAGAQPVDDVVEVVTEPMPVVTDTVRRGRFLATMARSHYGSYKFWVYIYLENKDKIPNPDNVPVGTVLIIPPAEKYGIDVADPQSVARAEAQIAALKF